MKKQFLKVAGVKTEAEFYKKYPSEAAFFKAHPEAKNLKKLKNGGMSGKPGVYSDGYSGTFSNGSYFGEGGSFVPEMYDYSFGLPQMMYGMSSSALKKAAVGFQVGDPTISLNSQNPNYNWTNFSLTSSPSIKAPEDIPNVNFKVPGVDPNTDFPELDDEEKKQLAQEQNYQNWMQKPQNEMSKSSWAQPFQQKFDLDPQYDASKKYNKKGNEVKPFNLNLNELGNFPNLLNTGLYLGSAGATFLENQAKKKQAKEKASLESLANNRTPITPIGVSGQRGDYDQWGNFRPDEYVVNKGMYTSNTPGLQLKQGGGMIQDETSLPLDEIRDIKPSIGKGESVENSEPIKLTQDFQNYASIADDYINSVNPDTDITGEMLAESAQKVYEKYGKTVPVELALAQLQQEGYLAKSKTANRPQRTKNPFNVGNTDNPNDNVYYDNIQKGIDRYYDLMATSYLNKKSPEELLENFVNSQGHRYATAGNYENSLKKIIKSINKKSNVYRDGGIYELTEDQIRDIISRGGNVEFI